MSMDRQELVEQLGEPETFRVRRDTDRDIEFQGWLIGMGDTGSPAGPKENWTRGLEVGIHRTIGGQYVAALRRWSPGETDGFSAAVLSTPAELLEWIRDSRGRLGAASKAAWEQACEADPDLAKERNEVVA